jgi:hypothetical protein
MTAKGAGQREMCERRGALYRPPLTLSPLTHSHSNCRSVRKREKPHDFSRFLTLTLVIG